jgi:hypothetical protein
MHLFDRQQFARLASVAVFAVLPAASSAQSTERKSGPEAGTWAAEASVGGTVGTGVGVAQSAAILRFFSPSTALVGNLSFSVSDDDSRLLSSGRSNSVALTAGLRKYTRAGLGLRPVLGGGLLFSRQSFGSTRFTNAGGYAEAGAVWFFNPHVSLGALGNLSAVTGTDRWSAGGSLARLTASVYF